MTETKHGLQPLKDYDWADTFTKADWLENRSGYDEKLFDRVEHIEIWKHQEDDNLRLIRYLDGDNRVILQEKA